MPNEFTHREARYHHLVYDEQRASLKYRAQITLSCILLFASLLLLMAGFTSWAAYFPLVICAYSAIALPFRQARVPVFIACLLAVATHFFSLTASILPITLIIPAALAGAILRHCFINLSQTQYLSTKSAELEKLLEAISIIQGRKIALIKTDSANFRHESKVLESLNINIIEKEDWQGFTQIQPIEMRKLLNDALAEAINAGSAEIEGLFIDNSGEEKHQNIVMSKVKSTDDIGGLVLMSTVDLHCPYENSVEDKIAQEFDDLLKATDAMVIGIDEEENIHFYNNQAKEYFSVIDNENTFAGDQCPLMRSVLSTNVYREVLNCIENIKRGAGSCRVEVKDPIVGKWFEIHLNKKISGFNLHIVDIDEQHQVHLELKQALLNSEMVQELGAAGSWHFDLQTRGMKLSSKALEILDIDQSISPSDNFHLLQRLLGPNDRLALTQAFIDVTHTEKPLNLFVTTRHHSGERIALRLALRCLFDEHKQPKTIVGSIQDITEQKAREAYLHDAERMVRGIIDALPNQICVIDQNGLLININKRWRDTAAPSGAEATTGRGENYLSVCDNSAAAGCTDARKVGDGIRAVINGHAKTFESEYCLEAGDTQYWYMIRVNPLHQEEKSNGSRFFVISHEDITPLKEVMIDSEEQRKQLALVQASTNDGLWDWQIDQNTTYYSNRFFEILRLQETKLPNFMEWFQSSLSAEHRTLAMNELEGCISIDEMNFDIECQLHCGDDLYRWFRLRGKGEFKDGRLLRFVGSLMDISEYRSLMDELNHQQQKFIEMANNIPDVFWDYNITTDAFIYVSPAFEQVWQYPVEAVEGQSIKRWINTVIEKDRVRIVNLYKSNVHSGDTETTEFRIQTANGGIRWISTHYFVIKGDNGKLERVVGTSRDITQSKLTLGKLKAAKRLDSLTGLDNRGTFVSKVEQYFDETTLINNFSAIIHIDVDRLTALNESIGYDTGDMLLKRLATRLRECCPNSGFVARVGGDEFAMFVPNNNANSDLNDFLKTLMSEISQPFIFGSHNFYITVSAGASVYLKDGQTPFELMRQADMMLQGVKNRGGDAYQIYEPKQVTHQFLEGHLDSELKHALDNKQFTVFYQPKVNTLNAQVCGCEALLRWRHPTQGLVPPMAFIGQLESSGLIVMVGELVLNISLAQLREWQQKGFHNMTMAVNVSTRQLLAHDFIDVVSSALERHSVRPQCLELEITETALVGDPRAAVEILDKLKKIGVSIAIDDFGTGYSSLSYLKAFKPHTVKIDKQFVDDINIDKDAYQVLNGIVNLCQNLGIHTVAEGVETEEQRKLLEAANCDLLQGYLFSRPLEKNDFTRAILEKGATQLTPA